MIPVTERATALSKTLGPDWQIMPQKFFGGHESFAGYLIQFWPTPELGPISLAKFVARISAGLPEDLPAEIVKKLIAQAIEVFEKSTAAKAIETAG